LQKILIGHVIVANWQWSIFWPKIPISSPVLKIRHRELFLPCSRSVFWCCCTVKPNNMEEISARKWLRIAKNGKKSCFQCFFSPRRAYFFPVSLGGGGGAPARMFTIATMDIVMISELRHPYNYVKSGILIYSPILIQALWYHDSRYLKFFCC